MERAFINALNNINANSPFCNDARGHCGIFRSWFGFYPSRADAAFAGEKFKTPWARAEDFDVSVFFSAWGKAKKKTDSAVLRAAVKTGCILAC